MKRLQAERQARGLSQTALARIVEVHPSFVAHIEAGRWVPSSTSPAARRLARFLGVPLGDLLAEVPAPEVAAARR